MVDNAMAKREKGKRTNINLPNTTQKTKNRATKTGVNSGAPEG